jgi:hypothetical protein
VGGNATTTLQGLRIGEELYDNSYDKEFEVSDEEIALFTSRQIDSAQTGTT